jgi:hypothetical protein
MKSTTALCFCFIVAALAGCGDTTISVLTQAPPGRTAALDVVNHTLTVTRGLAVVLECSEYVDTYSGPCRSLDVEVDGDDVVDVFDVHLDAVGGAVVADYDGGTERLVAPSPRKGALLAAKDDGDATVTLTASGAPVVLDLVVEPAPGDDDED